MITSPEVLKILHRTASRITAGMATFLFSSAIFANPVVDNVAAGQVSIQQTPTTTTVNQTSQKAIINWQSFNIAAPETTHFQQPAGGVALNRINPTQGPSEIYGRLTATGQIILVNPAGFYFGPGSFVNVGGIIASTADISNEDFLNNYYRFSNSSPFNGAIVTKGQIIAADNGLVALIGGAVSNDGMIQANMGYIVLASGTAFTMTFAGNDLIGFAVDKGISKRAVDHNGNAMSDGVRNNGGLYADGGRVLVSAKAAAGVLDNAINMRGIAQTKSIYKKDGRIILSSDPKAGKVKVSGKLIASGKNKGEKGGNIDITGYNILLASTSLLDVSGDVGGGNINIGGNYQGKGPLPNANAVAMESGAQIFADAISSGNGGNVILWSDFFTNAHGSISAQGGSESGNGGFIETSGKQYLDVNNIDINLSASAGRVGQWLLDPGDLTISTGGNFNVSGSSPFSPTETGSVLNVTTLTDALELANVTVQTTNDGFAGSGNITIANDIVWLSSSTLFLNAYNNIIINAGISAVDGALSLQAGSPSATITTNASGTINVKDFNLTQGTWTQVGALPAFNVSNNFQIDSGNMPGSNAAFIRATSGDGSSGSPYVITDVYGLQGMNSNSTTLSNYFLLGSNINASTTINWNSGEGFIPIGSQSNLFYGSLNGQGFEIDGLYINRSSNYLGLFGRTGSGSTLSNIGLTNVNLTQTSGYNFGALAGESASTITNSYATGTMTSTSSSSWNEMGGLVGYGNGVSISNSYSAVNLTSTARDVGGLVGWLGSGSISNSYATGSVFTTTSYAGGLVAYHEGSITNSYSTGSVSATGNVGGLLGYNGGTVTNSFWNSETSGQANSAGSSGAAGYRSMTTAQMQTLANFTTPANGFVTTSWDIAAPPNSATWIQQNGVSYPLLASLTRLITGTANGAANNTIKLAANGSIILTTTADANGAFYFLDNNNLIPSLQPFLVYVDNGNITANTIALAPVGSSGLNGANALVLTSNAVTAGNSGTSGALSNSLLGTALGAIIDSDILFSLSSNNLILNAGKNFITTSGTSYTLDGNVNTSSGGTISMNGTAVLNASTSRSINSAGNMIFGAATLASNSTLNLVSAANIIINGAISGVSGTLNLTAQNSAQSITTGTSGSVDVADFNLSQGQWYQNTASLPSFSASNNFLINSGTQFIRATSGNGSNTPYAISDVYGLQGINSNASTLSLSYQLNSNIDASATSTWNSGQGLKPIGSASTPFTGSINGQGYSVENLAINSPANTTTGLFGVIGTSGMINNLGVTTATININNTMSDGSIAAGILAGKNSGTITNSFSSGTITAANNNYFVGGLVGSNLASGNISSSYSTATVNAGSGSVNVGGFAGSSSGTINNTYSSGAVTANNSDKIGGWVGAITGGTHDKSYSKGAVTAAGSTNVGGLVGALSAGNVTNSFWDTETSGQNGSAAGTGKTTAEMKTNSTFTNAGWDFATVWNNFNTQTTPFLRSISANVTRTISGTSSAFSAAVNLVVNGVIAATTNTDGSGNFSFLYTNLDNTPVLVYLNANGGNPVSNTIALLPANGADLSIGLASDTVTAGSNITSASITTTTLSAALGSLVDSDILFSFSGANLILAAGKNFATTADTTFTTNGNITTTSGGTINMSGPANIGSSDTTFSSNGNLTLNSVTWSGSNALNLTSAANIILNGAISGANGSLNLSAANAAQSITTGANGSVNVANFNITQGHWYQYFASLPTFTVSNNFRLNSGTIPISTVNFTRVSSGDGGGTPFVIQDIFGLQGIGANSTNFTYSYQLGSNINASVTSNWNSGVGFKPIGTNASQFSGDLDGDGHTITNLYLNPGSGSSYTGLFGRITSTSYINDIVFSNPIIASSSNRTGIVAGFSSGTIDTITINSGSVTSGSYYIGGIVGEQENGSLNNLYVNNMAIRGSSYTGGIVGYEENATMTNLHNTNSTVGGGNYAIGGIVGQMWGGSLTNASNTANIGSSTQYASSIGGITGDMFQSALITNAWNSGTINTNSGDYVGGISGYMALAASITQSYNLGDVYAGCCVGGIAGGMDSVGTNITYSYNAGNVYSRSGEAGGITSQVDSGYLDHVYNTGNVVNTGGDLTTYWLGGIAGWIDNGGDITNAYNTGYISGIEGGAVVDGIGGIVGYSYTSNTILGNLYNTGFIAGSGPESAALIGEMASGSPTFSGNLYWNSSTSGQSVGIGNKSFAEVISKTDTEMKQQATFSSFNFASGSANWNIIENTSYPFMRFFYPDISTARVISGTTSVSGGSTIGLAYNGTDIDTAVTGNNGAFYFFAGNNALSGQTVIPNGASVMVYFANSSNDANSVIVAPTGYASITNASLAANTMTISGGAVSNSTLSTLVSGLSASDLLFSLSGNNLTLGTATSPTVNLTTDSSTTYTLNGNITNYDTNNGGDVTFNGPVTVSTDAVINLGTGDVTLASNVDGASALEITTSGNIVISGVIGDTTAPSSIDVKGGGNTTINSARITTSGSQIYRNPVTFGANTVMTVGSGAYLGFTGNASGSSLTLAGSGNNTFTMNGGTYNFAAINVNGSGTGNTLYANTGTSQTWNISGANAGSIAAMNLAFSGIQSLTGNNSENTFVFANGASLAGTIDGITSAKTNTMNFTSYSTPIRIALSSTYSGQITNSNGATIANFLNMTNTINNTATNNSSIALPTGKPGTVNVTGKMVGYINDPFYFTNFQTLTGAPGQNNTLAFNTTAVITSNTGSVITAIINGVTMTFENFTLGSSTTATPTTSEVASIVNEPNTDAEENDNYAPENYYTPTGVDMSVINETYTTPLYKTNTVKTGAACYGTY